MLKKQQPQTFSHRIETVISLICAVTKKGIFYFLFLLLSDLIFRGKQSRGAFWELQIWLSADQGIELASSNDVTQVIADMCLKVLSASGQMVMEFMDAAFSPGFHQFFLERFSISDGNYKISPCNGKSEALCLF